MYSHKKYNQMKMRLFMKRLLSTLLLFLTISTPLSADQKPTEEENKTQQYRNIIILIGR